MFGGRFARRVPAMGITKKRIPGTMNKTEARYEEEVLTLEYTSGRLLWYSFEGMTFKLGPDLRYTPDFVILRPDGLIECHEIKAGKKTGDPLVEDDARVKIIAAAEKFPFSFRMRWFDLTKGAWVERVY